MAEDSDLEKTEPASPRRLEKAREEGQVARSRELTTFLMLLAGIGGIWAGASYLYETFGGIVRRSVWFDPRVAHDPSAMVVQAAGLAGEALKGLAPLFLLLVVVAIFASIVLGGMSFSGKALQPKFERMNPAKGIKRMFSMQTVIELIKTLAKAGLVGSVAVYVIWTEREQMTALMYVHPTAAIATGMTLIIKCCALIAASLLVIVLIDAPWQLWSFYKKLRMSRQDVKEEHKESEGDPHVKGRIRQQQRSMARSRMMSQVPGADVVVTNPTHYAVALKYQDGKGGAPRVVAKGTGLIAAKIRGLAAEHKVAMLEAPALARALYFNVELEREIPVDLYSAVAEVLAWVYQLRNWNKGQGERPIMPTRLKVPTGMDEGPLRSRKH
ncbi:flagellar biosynthesis protein FlhB [Alcaligenes faecalis]|uniref:Flagellar biosynthetic protein FlhB n=1 Tax=Alcaligenes faecalis TaxID=511 RepID=A0AAE9KM73_ALCFA|nr:flagellar biosynthesis protein FlhB [Alcaligenes faecalis]UPL20297.1 flagellar type III secretion system protein FlhB [Alcaligenes faecalis]